MGKYIDADKLIAYLEQRKKQLTQWTCKERANQRIDEIDGILDVDIYYLQEERPEEPHFAPLNWLIQKIPSKNWNDTVNKYVRKLRDCLIKEGYRKDAEILQGYISYMNGNNVQMVTMDKREQPEVDLEKLGEIARHLIAVKDHEEDMRLDEGEWLLLERIGYPERFNAKKE